MRACMKLLGKCLAVSAPLIGLVLFFSSSMPAFVDDEAPYYLWGKEKTRNAQDQYYETVILGDSAANSAYMPEILSGGTINLAMGGTTAMENYYTLLDWLAYNPAPRVCYISFIDHHYSAEDCFWTRTMYSHRFSLEHNIEMLQMALAFHEPSVLTEHTVLDFISYQLFLPNKYITSFLNSSFNQRLASNQEQMRLAEMHSGRYIGRTTAEYAVEDARDMGTISVAPLFDVYLRKTADLCEEYGITMRVVHLPQPDNCLITDEYIGSFFDYFDALKEEYPCLTVTWFPTCEKSMFYDGNHMNSYGAMRFSAALKEMYPEDFTDGTMSDAQLEGLSSYIAQETSVTHLFDWVAESDYTAFLYDKSGKLESIYGGEVQTATGERHLTLFPVTAGQLPESGSAFYLSGRNEKDMDVTLCRDSDGALCLQLPGKELKHWSVAPENALGVLVADANGDTVCEMSFVYTEGAFSRVK